MAKSTGPAGKLALVLAMVLLGCGICHAAMPSKVAAQGNKGKQGKEYEPGEVIVKYRSSGKEPRERLHKRHGSGRIKEFSQFRMERVKIRSGSTVDQALREFQNDPEVEYVEPNYRVQAFAVPGDPSYGQLWGMAKINAPAAWDTSVGSGEVVVAVIDSGIDVDHSDLEANLWGNTAELNGQAGVDDDRNGVVDDLYGYNALAGNGDLSDAVGHGTHVAGTIGAVGNNGVGVAGVNWKVRIMSCKFLDATSGGTNAGAIDCLHYVAQMKRRGVNIVATSNSWGGGGHSRALSEAIDAQRDILFIAAAGNDATNNDSIPTYPANFDLPNVLAVAATTAADSLASFSQYGRRSVHLAAPGSAIYSTSPGNSYATHSGTSMAAPHVSGLAALIKSARPESDWREIRNLLLSGGHPLPALAGRTLSGRQIDALGSLTCQDNRLFSALAVPAPVPGTQLALSALSINCGAPLGPVTVTLSGGELFELKDDGMAPDLAAGDGIFSAYLPPSRGAESFYFSSPAGSERVAPQGATAVAGP